jgi:hypothetical protein
MIEHEVNKMNNFIMGFQIDEPKLCDDLIEYFKNTKEESNRVSPHIRDKNIVECTNCFLLSFQNKEIYINKFLDPTINAYIEKYTYSNVNKFEIMEMHHFDMRLGWCYPIDENFEVQKKVCSECSLRCELHT